MAAYSSDAVGFVDTEWAPSEADDRWATAEAEWATAEVDAEWATAEAAADCKVEAVAALDFEVALACNVSLPEGEFQNPQPLREHGLLVQSPGFHLV